MRRPADPWWYRLRWPLLVIWTAVCSALILRPGRAGIDSATLDRGARLLTGGRPQGGLHLYAANPSIQIGPLTLGGVRLVELIAGAHAAIAVAILGTALLFPALAVLERSIHLPSGVERRSIAKLVLVGGLFVVPAWLQSTVSYAHPDDVLVAACAAGALAAVARRRPAVLGLMLAVAIAAKPTAVVLAPLVLVFAGPARRSAMTVGAVGLLAWLPFVVADPRTLLAAQPQLLVQPGSGLTLAGAGRRAHADRVAIGSLRRGAAGRLVGGSARALGGGPAHRVRPAGRDRPRRLQLLRRGRRDSCAGVADRAEQPSPNIAAVRCRIAALGRDGSVVRSKRAVGLRQVLSPWAALDRPGRAAIERSVGADRGCVSTRLARGVRAGRRRGRDGPRRRTAVAD
jgi:hypothetical protein